MDEHNPLSDEDFAVGQTIVLPPHGPGVVKARQSKPSPAGEQVQLVLAFPAGHELTIDADEARQDARRPADRVTAEQALEVLRRPGVAPDERPFDERFSERMQIVSSGDLLRMAELLRRLYAAVETAGKEPRSPGERKFTHSLELQVLAELAAVLDLSLDGLRMEMGHRYAQAEEAREDRPEVDRTATPEPESPPRPAPAPPEPTPPPAQQQPPAVPCHLHPAKPASDSCARCLKPVCEVCALADAARFLCPECLRAVRRRRRIVGWSVGVTVVGLLAAILTWFLITYEEPFDYGRYQARVHKLSRRLEQEPCDRVKMLKFAELLLEAGDLERCVQRSRRFHADCGDFPRLLWVTYAANKRRGDYPAALADVGQLIEQWPYDKDFRWWRGEVYEWMRDWDRALSDYRQALGLQPKLRSIPFDLARVAERSSSPCEAIFALEQFVYHHVGYQEDPNLLGRLEDLYRKPACAGMAGVGQAQVPPDPEGGGVVQVTIDDRAAELVLDLDTPYTLIGQDLADELGLPAGEPFVAWDGERVRNGRLVVLNRVALGEARAEKVAAVVVKQAALAGEDGAVVGIQGVLGLTFLSRFALSTRPEDGALVLEPKLADESL